MRGPVVRRQDLKVSKPSIPITSIYMLVSLQKYQGTLQTRTNLTLGVASQTYSPSTAPEERSLFRACPRLLVRFAGALSRLPITSGLFSVYVGRQRSEFIGGDDPLVNCAF
jgi:hypothetical protein